MNLDATDLVLMICLWWGCKLIYTGALKKIIPDKITIILRHEYPEDEDDDE